MRLLLSLVALVSVLSTHTASAFSNVAAFQEEVDSNFRKADAAFSQKIESLDGLDAVEAEMAKGFSLMMRAALEDKDFKPLAAEGDISDAYTVQIALQQMLELKPKSTTEFLKKINLPLEWLKLSKEDFVTKLTPRYLELFPSLVARCSRWVVEDRPETIPNLKKQTVGGVLAYLSVSPYLALHPKAYKVREGKLKQTVSLDDVKKDEPEFHSKKIKNESKTVWWNINEMVELVSDPDVLVWDYDKKTETATLVKVSDLRESALGYAFYGLSRNYGKYEFSPPWSEKGEASAYLFFDIISPLADFGSPAAPDPAFYHRANFGYAKKLGEPRDRVYSPVQAQTIGTSKGKVDASLCEVNDEKGIEFLIPDYQETRYEVLGKKDGYRRHVGKKEAYAKGDLKLCFVPKGESFKAYVSYREETKRGKTVRSPSWSRFQLMENGRGEYTRGNPDWQIRHF